MPALLIIKLVVSILFYSFLIVIIAEIIRIRLFNKELKKIEDDKEKNKLNKQIKGSKNRIKFLMFGILFLFIISIFTSGFLK